MRRNVAPAGIAPRRGGAYLWRMAYHLGEGIPWRQMLLGFRQLCPCCGLSPIYRAYLKPVETCAGCGAALGRIRTDDIAPYFTILIVGHVMAPLLLFTEQTFHPPSWMHWAIWPALVLGLTFWGLPRVKGAILAVMLHLGLRGDETQ